MKPLVSYCILFYNQERYVRDALKAALAQDYENLEIIASDDCSSDGTYKVMQEIANSYDGPHKLIVRRNDQNMGISKHFNKVFCELAQGEFVVAAGGDDISLPNRTSKSVDLLLKCPKLQSVTFRSLQVDDNLEPLPYNRHISDGSYSIMTMADYCLFDNFIIFSGDSRTYRSSLFNKFPKLTYAHEEDLEFFIRSMLTGGVGIIREPLVHRRWHGNNVSGKPLLRRERNDQYKQMVSDVNYAYEKKYISEEEKNAMLCKVKQVRDFFYNQDDARRHPYINKFFKGIAKLSRIMSLFICQNISVR